MPPRKKRRMNDSFGENMTAILELNDNLDTSMERRRKIPGLVKDMSCNNSKEFEDNASKSSSGFGDEDFNEEAGEGEDVPSPSTSGVGSVQMPSYKTNLKCYDYDRSYVPGNQSREFSANETVDDDYDEDCVTGYESDGWTICSDSDENSFYKFLLKNEDDNNETLRSVESKNLIFDRGFVVRHFLSMYPPSEEMKKCNEEKFSLKSIQNTNEHIARYIGTQTLHPNNINLIFKTLLEIEDITCLSEYTSLAQKDVIVQWSERLDYWITIPDTIANIEDIVTPFMDELVLIPKESSFLAEANPPKFPIDTLFSHSHECEFDDLIRRRIAVIFKISKTQLHFRLSKDEKLSAMQMVKLPITKYDVIIRPRRLPVRFQYRALELLKSNPDVRHYLFPEVSPLREVLSPPKTELVLINQTIETNPEQLEAVRFLVDGPNPYAPFVIFGPPGTGKTTTIVESILQLRLHKPRSRILVTAGSNSACDTIALRICKYFNSNSQLQAMENRNALVGNQQKSIIRIYSKTIVEKGLHLIDNELRDNSNVKTGIHVYPSVEEIQSYGIVVATLCTVGKLVTGNLGEPDFFTHIFIDEAGASTEPEALVGIMGIKTTNCRVVLSGDHKQLGPILKSERAIQLGLEKSLLERLLTSDCYASDENCNYDCTIQARLKRNYRSHPEIVRLFNHLYYNNELVAEAKIEDVNMASKWDKLPNPNFPIIFQAVHGITEKDTITPSCCNNLEMQVLMWFLQRLLVDGINGQRVQQSDIGIITPYRLQNKLIQKRLASRNWDRVESGSVETFQGREKQIIIVSLVRSFKGLGFVRNPKRLNVILSRPKSLLILIGNPFTFKRHPDFNFIINECRRHNTFMRKKKNKGGKRLKLKTSAITKTII